ncbi:hypothetical protein AVEN_162870-1 [Araneus ventricosus]|uniref:Major facilitator superfamily (MFS) profile domain-containing protein n=1 Tax=Araneus ventricosus TaxID=182803 RepID=A0A4Y2PWC1_ARAVE|nr:hypothetical protein AVEN_162870-1 [Araneus ventricosus]
MNRIRLVGPDGMWSWSVAFACGAIMFIFVGFVRLSGMLFVAVLETFPVDRNTAARPFCTHYSVVSILGPVGGMLCQKYGARHVSVVGGVVASISAAVCFFAPNVTWITFLWGIVNGFGVALSTIAVRVAVGQHFVKHSTSALGLALSGGCIAPFALSLLLEKLLFDYGIHGAFLIIGAISLHTIPLSMMLGKPSWLTASFKAEHQVADVGEIGSNTLRSLSPYKTDNMDGKLTERFDLFKTKSSKEKHFLENFKDLPDFSLFRKNGDAISKIFEIGNKSDDIFDSSSKNSLDELENIYCLVEEFFDILFLVHDSEFLKAHNYGNKLGTTSKMEKFRIQEAANAVSDPLLEHERSRITVDDLSTLNILLKLRYIKNNQTEILNRFPEESKANITNLMQEMTKLDSILQKIIDIDREMNDKDYSKLKAQLNRSLDTGPTKYTTHQPNSIKELLKTLLQLYSNPLFLILTINRVVAFIGTHSLFTVIVDFAMDKGFSEGDGRYALVVTTLGEMVGRLCLGWVTDNGYMSVAKYMLLVTTLHSVTIISLPLIRSYASVLIMLTIIGVLQGSVYVQLYGIVSKYMKSHQKSVATGCINLLPGLLGFGIPAYIGYFRDTLGSYYYIFYINGTFGLVLGLFWILSSYLPELSTTEAVDGKSANMVKCKDPCNESFV